MSACTILVMSISLGVELIWINSSDARPLGPSVLCELWPEAPKCEQETVSCTPCHTAPPARDDFGRAIEDALWPDELTPDSDALFREGLLSELPTLAELDSDGDGFGNRDEFIRGSDPGDLNSTPEEEVDVCTSGSMNPRYEVCGYDLPFAFKRASLDFCGRSPTWEETVAFKALSSSEQRDELHRAVDLCLKGEYWLGRDGVLWRLAHSKIRPLQAIKSGENQGAIPLGDYIPDYALFAYALSGDRDARDLLLADYFVTLTQESPPRYSPVDALPDQTLEPERRAGMISSRWFLVINTMFTPLPRTTAAQAYRAYLGLDIAKSEGLISPQEPQTLEDYDNKGITEPKCAACHVTLDPLSYPFSRYAGIQGARTGEYNPQRVSQLPEEVGARLDEIPEAGVLLGQPVRDLIEWSERAANSDEFAKKIVLDFWVQLIGAPPQGAQEQESYERLWRDFMSARSYRAEAILHDLIDTLAYGRP